ncbi:nif-specific transcriptional activator NifA [Caldichromatium japonicum]|uniref:Nif-specific regulatory protein n=1 Tax=Caldichromatium japonicum TaxID=2699430 RepID=A0A6G7VET3_9GAMM|nr:nif-specific transcriptional activator NifA [Caldichromatium japonicum]QIK38549.1 nif-specific transcriptional activator NifA [Caldichromatium japonicum]
MSVPFCHLSIEALYRVSQVLSRSLDYRQTLGEVLDALAQAGLVRGLVSIVDPVSGELAITALHGLDEAAYAPVRYQSGEGVLGIALEEGEIVAIENVGRDPRFLNRLGIYDPALPFVAAPIAAGGRRLGVLAVQPDLPAGAALEDVARFTEMVANLIGQSVRLALEVEQEKQSLAEERDSLRRTVRGKYGFDNIVGRSAKMRKVFDQVRLVAKWNTTVLIRGETGTGKELIANAIHYNSPRARGPYVRLNCAALPENLLESELFGHEKGAFTGAIGARKGRFETADGGTLFLDEIGEISPAFQAKLLRVLQEGEFERVGSTRTLKVDVRVIAATHRDLEAAVDTGDFREDLYYRLNVMPIVLPPLRERSEDIPDLARHIVERIAVQQGRRLTLQESALRRLVQYSWPGNVRELENCLERAAVMSENGVIDAELIRLDRSRPSHGNPCASPAVSPAPSLESHDEGEMSERERVIAALEQAGWVQAKAARLLGMTPRQIAYRIQILGIEVKRF